MKEPIIDIIEKSIFDGSLPEGFVLPASYRPQEGSKWHYVPGQRDRFYIREGNVKPSYTMEYDVTRAIRASAAQESNALYLFKYLGERYKAINAYEVIQRRIVNLENETIRENLLQFAIEELILNSTEIECVKFGLVITACYGEPVTELKRYYSEFSTL